MITWMDVKLRDQIFATYEVPTEHADSGPKTMGEGHGEPEHYRAEVENERLNAAARREREAKAQDDKWQRKQAQGLSPKLHASLPSNAISAMDTEPWRMGWAREK